MLRCPCFRARQLGWKPARQKKLLQLLHAQGKKKKKQDTRNHPVFQDLELSGTQKARVRPIGSAFSFPKSILCTKPHFKTLLFKYLAHYLGEGVKNTIFCVFFNCIANLRRAQGAMGSQDANKYPACRFIICEGWGPKKLAARRSVNPVNDISNAAGCCRAKQRGRRGCEG